MIDLIIYYNYIALKVRVRRHLLLLRLRFGVIQATNWHWYNPNMQGNDVHWSVLINRYLLQLQGEQWKDLLDPPDTVVHHIVPLTKDTHLDEAINLAFVSLFSVSQRHIQWDTDMSCCLIEGVGAGGGAEIRGGSCCRLIDLIIYGAILNHPGPKGMKQGMKIGQLGWS